MTGPPATSVPAPRQLARLVAALALLGSWVMALPVAAQTASPTPTPSPSGEPSPGGTAPVVSLTAACTGDDGLVDVSLRVDTGGARTTVDLVIRSSPDASSRRLFTTSDDPYTEDFQVGSGDVVTVVATSDGGTDEASITTECDRPPSATPTPDEPGVSPTPDGPEGPAEPGAADATGTDASDGACDPDTDPDCTEVLGIKLAQTGVHPGVIGLVGAMLLGGGLVSVVAARRTAC